MSKAAPQPGCLELPEDSLEIMAEVGGSEQDGFDLGRIVNLDLPVFHAQYGVAVEFGHEFDV